MCVCNVYTCVCVCVCVVQLDEFLSKMENADYWRTIVDRTSGKEVVLTEEQVETIQNLQQSRFPDASVDPYQVTCDYIIYAQLTNHTQLGRWV